MDKEEIEKYKKAGTIASRAREYARSLAKTDALLIDIAKKTEQKIKDLGGKIAFPTNVSVNNSAAHYVPDVGDQSRLNSGDLVKIDVGVHIDGFIADTAITVLVGSDDEEKQNLINASEAALNEAIKMIKPGIELGQIGKIIEGAISAHGFQPIKNLSGHFLDRYELHSRMNIPNYDNKSDYVLDDGDVIAIEPFATTGEGLVKEGTLVNSFSLVNLSTNIRQNRDILAHIKKNFKTMPFARRWLNEKFGKLKTGLFIRQLQQNEVMKGYPVLNERSGGLVSQAEHTIIVFDKPIITTK